MENRPKAAWPRSRMTPVTVKREAVISTQKTKNILHEDSSKCTYEYEKSDVINNETSDDCENQGMGFL